MDKPTISLICTVRDEADNIAALLDSMLAQTLTPDEIIINDCQSRDETPAIVTRYIGADSPVRLVRGGHNISSGRNNAIRHARGAIIACTDAGLILDRHWLERITAPLRSGQADIVGGFFRAAPHSLFEVTLGATNYREADEIDPERFLPFGKSCAFQRDAWADVGGYPEWASHCEDILFALALKNHGARFAFAPEAIVWFRPRGSLRAFARQYYFYSRGDGVAGLWGTRHAVRYATYAGAAGITLASRRYPWMALLLLAGILAYCRAPFRRLRLRAPGLNALDLARAAALIPIIRVVGDLAKMAGYPVGVIRRLRTPVLHDTVRAYRRR